MNTTQTFGTLVVIGTGAYIGYKYLIEGQEDGNGNGNGNGTPPPPPQPEIEDLVETINALPVERETMPGAYAKVTYRWRNVGSTNAIAAFRLAIKKSGFSTTYEGPWITSSCNPGQEASVELKKLIPANWDDGANPIPWQIQLQIQGNEKVVYPLNTGWCPSYHMFYIPMLGEVFVPVSADMIEQVVNPGNYARVTLVWENLSSLSQTAEFRLCVRKSGLSTTSEGPWIASSCNAKSTKSVNLKFQIPSNWNENANPIVWQIQLRESSNSSSIFYPSYGDWDSDQFYILGDTYFVSQTFLITDMNPAVSYRMVNRDPYSITLSIDYKGKGGHYKFGVMQNYTPAPQWASATVFLPPSPEFSTVDVILDGVWNTNLPSNRRVAMLKGLQTQYGSLNDSGENMILADWDWGWFTA